MDIFWIWLSELPYVGPVTSKRLLDIFSNPKRIYEAEEHELKAIKRLSKRALASILTHRSLDKSKRRLEQIERKNIKLLRYDDSRYPQHAKRIKHAPVLLYYIGHIASFSEAVAVVGSRRCTNYGKAVAVELAGKLAEHGVPTISGMAKGIDSYAQTACLQNDGYTIAFVASGVDICYPKEHRALYEQICERGAVISEYPPGARPIPQRFVERNRLISAWATKVVIVEAGKKSGALSTATYAGEQGKDVYAVPNRIDIVEGKGTNRLISEGATPYLDFSSLGLALNKRLMNADTIETAADKWEQEVVERLVEGPMSVLQLANELKCSDEELREKLFTLELEGKLTVRGDAVTINRL